jgi:hypothetical protein
MYNQNDGKLVRVNDESELEVGMACKLFRCVFCGGNHVFNIPSKVHHKGYYFQDNTNELTAYNGYKFLVIPGYCKHPKASEYRAYFQVVKEGRLFRIVDENPICDSIEKERDW